MAISLPGVVSAACGRVKLNSATDKFEAMRDLYDHEVAVVDPARSGEADGIL